MTLSGKARLAGVMGHPVAHSLSPRLHGYWLEYYGIDGAYLPLPVRPDDTSMPHVWQNSVHPALTTSYVAGRP